MRNGEKRAGWGSLLSISTSCFMFGVTRNMFGAANVPPDKIAEEEKKNKTAEFQTFLLLSRENKVRTSVSVHLCVCQKTIKSQSGGT